MATKNNGRCRVARFQSGVFRGIQGLVEVVEALEAPCDGVIVDFDCECIATHCVLKVNLRNEMRVNLSDFTRMFKSVKTCLRL